MQQPTIRRADPSDAQVLSELGARTFAETFAHLYPPQDLADFLEQAYGLARTQADLADPAKAQWLVEAGGAAVGYALAGPCDLPHPEVTPASGELKRFYLLKDWQGGGTGGRLFAEVMAWLEREGPRDLWIGVWSENFGAQRFYRRHGFEQVGAYGFQVGGTVDHEFILRRAAQGLST
ncbi:GNAT family N-acetyltransferase [Phenylobacterium sp. 58.2.17]|uniref:GNAT family N-acetyltransferase n=1 Tax=Phenylobacterium sp. 58.2.17 TaxID=2969306 RepID=UPI002264DA70|nr:GNAT family N-acetyltransferase [Phenylobacterium sp. 58.2.17]MCX7585576.1 GNAT family N-acetyltransferase [Phenylobacterium sp. 58.2.17]